MTFSDDIRRLIIIGNLMAFHMERLADVAEARGDGVAKTERALLKLWEARAEALGARLPARRTNHE